eukprot:TRINITY_DN7549_c0_g1_i1.p1 TRINITY_DN7549_c0_g1~~TRINITY_DN7549_c0_g1_i1.p1  ORF type:complete len:321 (+),score=16.41 TRINITY_DN7549_c0_g1_i1:23-964(+)
MNDPRIRANEISSNGEISPLYLSIDEVLGRGFFGEVYHGVLTLSHTEVACKVLNGRSMFQLSGIELFNREVSILRGLDHPNVIKYIGTCNENNRKMIVTEYMENGPLKDYLHNNTQMTPDIGNLFRIACDIVSGMKFLHERNPPILHRDLNCGNILLGKDLTAKVADFGLSREASPSLASSLTLGKVPWMAPEVLEAPSNYTTSADVYSFGILFWEMVTFQHPSSHGMDYRQLAHNVVHHRWRLDVPASVDPYWRGIIMNCITDEPSQRKTFAQILSSLKEIESYVPPPLKNTYQYRRNIEDSIPNQHYNNSY